MCNTTTELDQLLEDEKFMIIINSSRWPVTKPINIESKMDLLNCLVTEELIYKRLHNIEALRKGLSYLGFLDFCHRHMLVAKFLFIYESQPLHADQFTSLLESHSKVSLTSEEETALNYFYEYITHRETATKGWYIPVCIHDCFS